MPDWLLEHMQSILVALGSALSVGWGVVQWVYSYVDTRISANSDDVAANADEITALRVRTSRHEDRINALHEHTDRLREQSSREHKELWQAVSALPSKGDMASMQQDIREIREILINKHQNQNGHH